MKRNMKSKVNFDFTKDNQTFLTLEPDFPNVDDSRLIELECHGEQFHHLKKLPSYNFSHIIFMQQLAEKGNYRRYAKDALSEIKRFHEGSVYQISYKAFIRGMTVYRKMFRENPIQTAIINKLIGDKKLFSKMMFTGDGSYRNNRIWFNRNQFIIRDFTTPESWSIPTSIEKAIDMINFIYNHYDVIWVMIPIYNDFKLTLRSIEEKIYRDIFDTLYDEYLDDPMADSEMMGGYDPRLDDPMADFDAWDVMEFDDD